MKTVKEVAYGSHEKQRFDLYLGDWPEPRPLLVHIHGGGFSQGDKGDIRPAIRDTALELGMHVAAVNYRLMSEVRCPVPFHDVSPASRTRAPWRVRRLGGRRPGPLAGAASRCGRRHPGLPREGRLRIPAREPKVK